MDDDQVVTLLQEADDYQHRAEKLRASKMRVENIFNKFTVNDLEAAAEWRVQLALTVFLGRT